LHGKLIQANVPFEILVLDDGSTVSISNQNTASIKTLSHVSYSISKTNSGRTRTRQHLALKARFDWLLFLDADMLVKNDYFITRYLQHLSNDIELVYGGFCYGEKPPEKESLLRYTFGKKREELSAKKRNICPFKTITSANMLIQKAVFLAVNDVEDDLYGLDYYFTAKLKARKTKVLHIDNEAIHVGIEQNDVFIKKTKKAVQTLFILHKNNRIKDADIALLSAFKSVSAFGLNSILRIFYQTFKNMMLANLESRKPSLFIFDIYRLSYLCALKHQQK
jgi:glycosyltransferase involved in cell wall biosynthesis